MILVKFPDLKVITSSELIDRNIFCDSCEIVGGTFHLKIKLLEYVLAILEVLPGVNVIPLNELINCPNHFLAILVENFDDKVNPFEICFGNPGVVFRHQSDCMM